VDVHAIIHVPLTHQYHLIPTVLSMAPVVAKIKTDAYKLRRYTFR
jgi:hypothetical protein